ncbi:hypothetical protein, partial [Enterococcus faecium]|uniref:hypothetical protein n=1 Tax=Enterococcus faecium TaxID=1352 RepID=UPI001C6136F5
GMFLWLKTLYRKRAVTWPFIFYTIIWTLSIKEEHKTNDFVLRSFLYVILKKYYSFYVNKSLYYQQLKLYFFFL